MKWIKKGRIYKPDKSKWYSQSYGILPTPDFIPERNVIRIYFSTTDKEKFGRILFLEVNADNPKEVTYILQTPCLDIGSPGSFDDCGVNPSCIVTVENKKLLLYIGYQRSVRVPYTLFAGLAEIRGEQLVRMKTTPLLERIPGEETIRSATTVLFENGIYKMWYVSAHRWEKMNTPLFQNKLMPNYLIKYAESIDFKSWNVVGGSVINYEDKDEFGFGRPWVIKDGELYKMWYSVRKRNTSYRIGYAESMDGINWKRKDHEAGIDVSDDGWDSEMICYPAVIKVKNKTYMFYNGNNNGETGFGYAELIRE